MRTTLHGDWDGKVGAAALYPHFTPFLTKFADNGGARSAEQVRGYLRRYRERGFFGHPPGDAGAAEWAALRPYFEG